MAEMNVPSLFEVITEIPQRYKFYFVLAEFQKYIYLFLFCLYPNSKNEKIVKYKKIKKKKLFFPKNNGDDTDAKTGLINDVILIITKFSYL